MPARTRLALAVAVALVSLAGIVIVVMHWTAGESRAPAPLGLHETNAVAPFAGYREVRLAIGAGCARFVVADTEKLRERGLRGVADLGPYAGMLFVQARDTDVAFTMSGVSTPLDLSWYAADGTRVGGAHLSPCPRGAAAPCAVYRSRRSYRLAVEIPFDEIPSGEPPAGASPARPLEAVAPCV